MDLNTMMHTMPTIILGMIGHVADGKSTISKALSGKKTQQFSDELEHGITIKLGYANVKFFKCNECAPPKCYSSGPSSDMEKFCKYCGNESILVAHVSLVDCPGHQKLTSTMWSGTCIMDYTILVESITNAVIPAPQTWEHMVATQIAGIPNAAVCLNKVDIVGAKSSGKKALFEKVDELRSFVKEFDSDKIVIPTSAVFGINMDVLCECIANLPVKEKDFTLFPKMIGIRSFDINEPVKLTSAHKLKGGTLGGSLVQGILKVGDTVLIYPGHSKETDSGETKCKNDKSDEKIMLVYKNWEYYPIEATVMSIYSETECLETAIPGGLVGVQLDVDPGLTRKDKMVGHMLVTKGCDHEICVTSKLLLNITDIFPDIKTKTAKAITFTGGVRVKVHVNADEVDGTIKKYKNETQTVSVFLDKPVAVCPDSKIVLSEYKSGNIIARCDIIESVSCDLMQS